MQQFKDLLQHIVTNGRQKGDRTGTGTVSVFGYQMRFDLSKGFPLVTLKKTHVRSIVHELLWFLKGETNIQYLQDNKVSIWDEWATTEDITVPTNRALSPYERLSIYADREDISIEDATRLVTELDYKADTQRTGAGGLKFLDDNGIPTHDEVVVPKGSLGPVYGAQWRKWLGARRTKQGVIENFHIDQIDWCINRLKTNPTCRRIIVTAWNPADLPQAGLSPSENAAEGYQALAACHTMFQFYAEELTLEERLAAAQMHYSEEGGVWSEVEREALADAADAHNAPKYRLSCQLYQRSADVTLGVPFNIASYALLTHMVAQVVNMVPGDFVHTFGDAHIYSNHFEANNPDLVDGGVETLLEREPKEKLPTLVLNPAVKNIDDFKFDDIKIEGYESYPNMRLPIAV